MSSYNEASHPRSAAAEGVVISAPKLRHGAGMWTVAKNSGELDLNSSYMYLLFARDFATTCRVALDGDRVVAFVLGYRRPEEPECVLVWQIAVDATHQGQGLAGRLLDELVRGLSESSSPVTVLETTITDDNIPSQRLFERFAQRWGASVTVTDLFDDVHFPDQHAPERLRRIGPLRAASPV